MCNRRLQKVERMEYGSIERELHIDASPDVVFEVVSSPAHIRDWWGAETRFAPVAGSVSRLTWTDDATGTEKSTPFTVVEVDPPRRFSFRWTYDDALARPGNSLLVTFELVASAGGTLVRFTESGFRERGWDAAVLEAYYQDHERGWDHYLPRLAGVATRRAALR
jgi:uncharacterized protein YndB with AHSA1/START domain